jgi:hypothetical protein
VVERRAENGQEKRGLFTAGEIAGRPLRLPRANEYPDGVALDLAHPLLADAEQLTDRAERQRRPPPKRQPQRDDHPRPARQLVVGSTQVPVAIRREAARRIDVELRQGDPRRQVGVASAIAPASQRCPADQRSRRLGRSRGCSSTAWP